MKITDSIWNNIDIVQPKVGAIVIVLIDGREYETIIYESDLEFGVIRCFSGLRSYGDLIDLKGSKLWKYYENN